MTWKELGATELGGRCHASLKRAVREWFGHPRLKKALAPQWLGRGNTVVWAQGGGGGGTRIMATAMAIAGRLSLARLRF